VGEEVFCGGGFDGPTRIKEKLRPPLQSASTKFSVLIQLVNSMERGGAVVN
jgi:hypothetical protein